MLKIFQKKDDRLCTRTASKIAGYHPSANQSLKGKIFGQPPLEVEFVWIKQELGS